ncbi:uncharacterized protein T551_03425 [Pneumocystis jirovecii RU7]|uniref:Mso1 N-terminal domain-containing protein n=1 Tax=Pneumocystis jirovecii (strain RU7) TaxID=1408657 RepID=A0A0W4ZDP7_PNEJ7|nr:uncharacterized protein T551_03425 [Pneumocystis jirovecii RU7]KTW26508.1 hypothetical protein T551_03425 [Pneumocystis jirovecii RU7]
MNSLESRQLIEVEENHGQRMWDRIVSATGAISKAVADKYVAIVKEDEDHNIDNEDQSKVSRVLREYYIRKTGCLPDWLMDSKTPKVSSVKSFESASGHHSSSNFNAIESTKSMPVSFRDIYDSTPKHFESIVKSTTFSVDESRHRNLSASERLREKLSTRRNTDYN